MGGLEQPLAGVDFSGSLGEVRAWFPDNEACLDHLTWLRWGDYGFVCHLCGDLDGWQSGQFRWEWAGCKARISPTAGTIFHGTRTPLTVWFEAGWLMTTQAYGASALGLQRVLGLGSHQTAGTMLHKYRLAMLDPDCSRLDGIVEADEVFIGGNHKAGAPGRAAKPGVSIAVALVERRVKGFGRTRLVVVPDSSAQSFEAVLREHVEPTATVATDAWEAWEKATKEVGYAHDRTNVSKSGKKAHEVLPAVSWVPSQLERWLGGTLRGAVTPDHLQAYCHEFEFRFNRRRSRHRGQLFYRLLSQAARTPPTGYADLVRIGGAKKPRLVPPAQRRVSSATLAQPEAGRPWRTSRDGTADGP